MQDGKTIFNPAFDAPTINQPSSVVYTFEAELCFQDTGCRYGYVEVRIQ